jgi:hypothetical protein
MEKQKLVFEGINSQNNKQKVKNIIPSGIFQQDKVFFSITSSSTIIF